MHAPDGRVLSKPAVLIFCRRNFCRARKIIDLSIGGELMRVVKMMTLGVAVTLGALPVVAVHAKPPPNSQAGGLPAVSARVRALEAAVETLQLSIGTLQANGVGAGVMAARIVGLPTAPGDSFGAVSGTSDQNPVV